MVSGFWLKMLVALGICIIPFFAWFLWISSPARSTGHRFLELLGKGDCGQAYELCSPGLQKAVGDPEKLKKTVTASRGLYQPWFWSSSEISEDRASLESQGEVLGREHTVRLQLEKRDGKWMVSSVYSTVSGEGTLNLTASP
jgi:hypothetical protein